MTPTFEDSTAHVRQQCAKLAKDYKKAIGGTYVSRRWRAFKWKYDNNPVFRDVIDALWVGAILGLICCIILGISIVQYFNPWL